MTAAPHFVGRGAELARLNEIFVQVQSRASQAVLIAGEPGIGKTRLAEVFSEHARSAGALVVTGRAWDGGGAPPYWPVLEALRALTERLDSASLREALGDHAAPLAALLPELAERAGVKAEDTTERGRFELFAAVSHVFRNVADTRPLVVVIDDLHAADLSSIALVRFICRRRDDARLLLLATYRNVDARSSEESRHAIAELSREATTLVLGGLSASAVAEWLGDSSESAATASDQLVRLTAGNPLFIDGILRARRDTGTSLFDSRLVLSLELKSAIAARFATLAEDSRRLIEALAVVGRPAALSLLARVLERPFEVLLDAAGVAIQAGLLAEAAELGQYRFYHPLVQEVGYASLAPAVRIRLHARVASALDDLYRTDASSHLPELARHALAAAPLGKGADAVLLCHAAGRRGMELGAFEDAARNFADARGALAYVDPGKEPPIAVSSLLADLGDAELASGRLPVARDIYEELADVARRCGDADTVGRAALGFARTFEFGVLEPRRLALLEEAALGLEPGDSGRLARVLARLAQELWMLPGSEERRKELAARAITMGRRLDDDETTAFALNAWLQSVWGPEHRTERQANVDLLVRLADRSRNLERLLEAHRWRINVAVEHGEIDRAEAAMQDYARVAEALRRPDYLANAMMRLAMLPQLRGELDRAHELAAATRDLQRRAGDPQAEVVFDSRRILMLESSGRRQEVAELLPAMRSHVAARSGFTLYRAILVRGLLAAGKRSEAASEWERVWQNDLADVSRDMMWPSTLALLVPACVALGDRHRAERLHALLLPFASLHAAIGASYSLGSVARYVGLLEEMLGRSQEAAKHLEAALVHNQSMGARLHAEDAARDLERIRGTSALAAVRSPSERQADNALLRHEGAVWLVEHAGTSARVKHSLGLSYLRVLLERPGVEVHVIELVDALSGPSKRHAEPPADADPAIDARARVAYRQRIEALRETLAEAESFSDTHRAERARAEIETITLELSRAFGLGGRARPTASGGERARTSVTKALTRAVAAIQGAVPALGSHLERAVRTGTFCCYDPEPRSRIVWIF
jgi:tetratricopeptide (TPR) repeat protein